MPEPLALADPAPSGSVAERKAAWRTLIRRTRRQLVQQQGPAGRAAQAEQMAAAALHWVRRYAAGSGRAGPAGLTATAYAAMPTEPPVAALVEALAVAEVTVLLPLTLPDGHLDWHRADDPAARPLGDGALQEVDVAFVPALAVDLGGVRLGQGGGYYDRALAGLPAGVPTIAVLHDHELVRALPTDEHDIRVQLVLTARSGVAPVTAR